MDIAIDITDTIIETPRLVLRPWKETDLADFYEYASVDGVGEPAGWKHHESIEKTKEILQKFIDSKNDFALELKRNRKVIGSFGIKPSWANDSKYANLKVKEIGYVLSKDYWGQGLMPEAVKAVTKYFFDVIGLDAITVGHFVDNTRSKRVIEKCGFTYVAQGEVFVRQLNKTLTECRYILFRK